VTGNRQQELLDTKGQKKKEERKEKKRKEMEWR